MATTQWSIDPAHSEIQFKVKHLMISNVSGSFTSFSGSAETEGDDFENAQVAFSADLASINTNNEQRDEHLRSDLFFDAEKFPTLSFRSTGMTKGDEDEYNLTGDLTIKGATQPVTFKAEAGGIAKDMRGNTKAAFSLSGKINRKDFGLTWNAALETGGVVLSDEVRLLAEVQLLKGAQ